MALRASICKKSFVSLTKILSSNFFQCRCLYLACTKECQKLTMFRSFTLSTSDFSDNPSKQENRKNWMSNRLNPKSATPPTLSPSKYSNPKRFTQTKNSSANSVICNAPPNNSQEHSLLRLPRKHKQPVSAKECSLFPQSKDCYQPLNKAEHLPTPPLPISEFYPPPLECCQPPLECYRQQLKSGSTPSNCNPICDSFPSQSMASNHPKSKIWQIIKAFVSSMYSDKVLSEQSRRRPPTIQQPDPPPSNLKESDLSSSHSSSTNLGSPNPLPSPSSSFSLSPHLNESQSQSSPSSFSTYLSSITDPPKLCTDPSSPNYKQMLTIVKKIYNESRNEYEKRADQKAQHVLLSKCCQTLWKICDCGCFGSVDILPKDPNKKLCTDPRSINYELMRMTAIVLYKAATKTCEHPEHRKQQHLIICRCVRSLMELCNCHPFLSTNQPEYILPTMLESSELPFNQTKKF